MEQTMPTNWNDGDGEMVKIPLDDILFRMWADTILDSVHVLDYSDGALDVISLAICACRPDRVENGRTIQGGRWRTVSASCVDIVDAVRNILVMEWERRSAGEWPFLLDKAVTVPDTFDAAAWGDL
jgi:hypothetical protein